MRVTLTWLGYPQDPEGRVLSVEEFDTLPQEQRDTLLKTMEAQFPQRHAEYSGATIDPLSSEPVEASESPVEEPITKKRGRPRKTK